MTRRGDHKGRPLLGMQQQPNDTDWHPNNIVNTYECNHIAWFHNIGSTGVRGHVLGAPTRGAPAGCGLGPTCVAGIVGNRNNIGRMHR